MVSLPTPAKTEEVEDSQVFTDDTLPMDTQQESQDLQAGMEPPAATHGTAETATDAGRAKLEPGTAEPAPETAEPAPGTAEPALATDVGTAFMDEDEGPSRKRPRPPRPPRQDHGSVSLEMDVQWMVGGEWRGNVFVSFYFFSFGLHSYRVFFFSQPLQAGRGGWIALLPLRRL